MNRTPLGKVLNFFNGKAVSTAEIGRYPVYGSNGTIGFADKYKYSNSIIIGRVGAYCGSINYERGKYWASDNTIVADAKEGNSIAFLSYVLRALPLNSLAGGSAQPLINQTILSRIATFIPDPDAQQKNRGDPFRLRRPDREQPAAHRAAGKNGRGNLPGVVCAHALSRTREGEKG